MRLVTVVFIGLLVVGVWGCNNGSASVAPVGVSQTYSGGPGSNLIWVADYLNDSLYGYKVGDTGDVAPTQIVAGPHTQLDDPLGIFKTGGTLFVTNWDFITNNPTVNLYPVSSNGDVAPTNIIAGPHTGLTDPAPITVANAGTIIVGNFSAEILSFAPGKFGDVTPIRAIVGQHTQLSVVNGLATHNGLLYASNEGAPGSHTVPSIVVFHVLDNGDVAPIRVISGPHTGLSLPSGLKLDKAGDLYVANGGANTVTEYAPGATGDASPITTLQGSHTLLNGPRDLVLNSQESRVFVVNQIGRSITGYNLPANGDQMPFMDISGQNTMMNTPVGIAF